MKPLAGGLAALAVAAYCLACSSPREPAPEYVVRRRNPVASSEDVLTRARSDFRAHCVECHGLEGKGDGPTSGMLGKQPADLTNPAVLGSLTDGEIFWTVSRGDRPIMPAFEGKLTEEERWGLVHLMRTLSNTLHDSSPRARR